MSIESVSEPILFMSNHPVAYRLLPGVLDLAKERKNLVVVTDAAYERVLKKLGLEVIGINSPNKIKWTADRVDKARVFLTRVFGVLTSSYDNALDGRKAVEVMVETLKSGNDLFICPTGVSDPNARWRSGVGSIAIALSKDPIRAGFIFIPNSFFARKKVVIGPVVGSLINSSDGTLCPKKVAEQLHNLYSESFGF